MQGIRLRARPLLLAALAVAVGVGAVLARGATAEAAGAPRLTSHQIADAVLFNDGEAAGYLASLRRGPTPWSPELRVIQTDVHKKMSSDAYYGRGFAEAMQSGDPRAVDSALNHLGATMRAVLETRYGSTEVEKAVALFDKWWSDEGTVKGSINSNAVVNYRELSEVYQLDNVNDVDDAIVAHNDVSVGEDVVVVTDAVAVVAVVVAAVAIVAAVIVFVAGYGTDRMMSGRTRLMQEVLLRDVAGGFRFGR